MKTIERHRAHATPCKQPCSHEVAQMSQHRRCHALYLQCMMSSDGRQFLGPCIQLPVNIICDGIGNSGCIFTRSCTQCLGFIESDMADGCCYIC